MAKKRNRGKKNTNGGMENAKSSINLSESTPPKPSSSAFSNIEFGICIAFLLATCLYLIQFLFIKTDIGTRFEGYLSLLLNASIYWAYWTGSPEGELHLLDRWPILLGFAFHSGLAFGCGAYLLKRLAADCVLTWMEHILLSVALGLAIISTFTLTIGFFQIYAWKQLLILPVFVLSALGFWTMRLEINRDRLSSDLTAEPQSAHWTRWIWVAGLPFLAILFLGSMIPPWEYDVREYHLQVPKEWYQAGGVSFLTHNVYGNMPLGTEMQALFAMLYSFGADDWWWGAMIGKTVSGFYAILNFGLLYCLGRRLFGEFAGLLAALIYVSTPWTIANSIIGYNEGALSCYLLAALFVATVCLTGKSRNQPQPKAGPLVILGMLVGAAVSCKYTAVPFVAIPAVMMLLWILDRSQFQNWLKGCGWVLAGILLICGPWFGKNLYMTGNPTYPLLSGVFASPLSKEQARQWNDAHSAPEQKFSVKDIRGKFTNLTVRYKWLSPLLIPFLFLLILSPNRRVIFPLAGFLLYVFVVWWFATHRLERFLFPFYPIACLVAGAGCQWTHHKSWKNLVACVLIVGCCLNFLFASSRIVGDIRVFADLDQLDVRKLSARDYSHPDDQIYKLSHLVPEIAWLNENEPKAKVLFFGECRAFAAEFEVIYNTCFDRCETWILMHNRNDNEIHEALLAEGITHILLNVPELNRMRSTYGYNVADEGAPIDEERIYQLETRVLERVVFENRAQPSGIILFRVISD